MDEHIKLQLRLPFIQCCRVLARKCKEENKLIATVECIKHLEHSSMLPLHTLSIEKAGRRGGKDKCFHFWRHLPVKLRNQLGKHVKAGDKQQKLTFFFLFVFFTVECREIQIDG